MARPAPLFYVLHGSDEFTRAEAVAQLRQRLGPPEMADLNTTWLDGGTVTLGELVHACETVPFLSERRLVVVEGLLTRLWPKGERVFLDGLLRLLQALPETTRLVFIEEGTLAEAHPVLRLAREHHRGFARSFEPPTPLVLPRWIVQRVQSHGGQIEPEAAARLARLIGQDLRLLDQEIQKLVTYAGPQQRVTVAQVERLVPYAQQAVIFDLVDALGQREGKLAASTLQQLLEEGQNPQGILAMIVRQFRLLIQAKELREGGESPASVARILGLHPFPAGKLYRQAANFTMTQLEQVYRHLLQTDLDIKGGDMTPEAGMGLLLAGLVGG